MKERIRQFIEHKGLSAGELANIVEVQRSNISHILNGRNKPGALFIEKMLIEFPDLNARWLLTGEGKMLTGADKPQFITSSENDNAKETIKKNLETSKKETIAATVVPAAGVTAGPLKTIKRVILIYDDNTFESFVQ